MAPPNHNEAGSSSSRSDRPSSIASHHRRRSSTNQTLSEQRVGHQLLLNNPKARPTSAKPALSPVPGTPNPGMSLSRSPSPVPGGGWASPGLSTNSGRSSPAQVTGGSAAWESAKMRNHGVNGYPSFSTQKSSGFLVRHMRQISSSLPRFAPPTHAQKTKSARDAWTGQQAPFLGRIGSVIRRVGRRLRWRTVVGCVLCVLLLIFYNSHLSYWYRRASWGGDGQKYVIILGANVGGGVMEWKGAREWAIERDSVRNKRKYAKKWGYDLEIVDMSTKKRYAHEWRESWEKVDFVRSAMKKYPKAEWFWWLDLNTYIMELSFPLQDHLFTDLEQKVYRDINEFNPLNISHPLTAPYLDADALSPIGDGNANSLNLLLTQDCAGFNLGSFLIRRSAWTERLLDIWWDPVLYEQKHMEWEHKEQDALEQMYESMPWVRQHTGFFPQRKINAFPPSACSDDWKRNDTRFHYNEHDHDMVVNMAGCEWGRDCWGEMYHYREFGYWLNRNPWERFKEDFVAEIWNKMTGQRIKL